MAVPHEVLLTLTLTLTLTFTLTLTLTPTLTPTPTPNPDPNNHRLPRLCTLQTASALLRRRCSTSSSEMRRPRYAGPNLHPLTLTLGPLADPRPEALTPYPEQVRRLP